MIKTYKYDFSFTAASLRLPDMVLVADALLNGRTIDYTNELGNGKAATGKRMLLEYQNRLPLFMMATKSLTVIWPATTSVIFIGAK